MTIPRKFDHCIRQCPRCGREHRWLEFRLLLGVKNRATHFAYCPTTSQPILIRSGGKQTELFEDDGSVRVEEKKRA